MFAILVLTLEYNHLLCTLLIINSNKFTHNKTVASAVCRRRGDEQRSSKTNICTLHSAFGITLSWKQQSDDDQRLCWKSGFSSTVQNWVIIRAPAFRSHMQIGKQKEQNNISHTGAQANYKRNSAPTPQAQTDEALRDSISAQERCNLFLWSTHPHNWLPKWHIWLFLEEEGLGKDCYVT